MSENGELVAATTSRVLERSIIGMTTSTSAPNNKDAKRKESNSNNDGCGSSNSTPDSSR